ncbi:hypothetical protein M0805_008185 [Coniferiporia weirii]|nr:hypothetical protein M0805_008185 [Coniferiporia weirii]
MAPSPGVGGPQGLGQVIPQAHPDGHFFIDQHGHQMSPHHLRIAPFTPGAPPLVPLMYSCLLPQAETRGGKEVKDITTEVQTKKAATKKTSTMVLKKKKAVANAEKKPATKMKKKKATGLGARSGTNAHEGGASDDEIKKLSEDDRNNADIIVPKCESWDEESDLKLVEYVTACPQWKRIPLLLSKVCKEASQLVFNNERSPMQCKNHWQKLYWVYKDAHRLTNHMGSGDGDDIIDPMGSGDEDKGDKGRYHQASLQKFIDGPLYPIIDLAYILCGYANDNTNLIFRASTHEDVIRNINYNSGWVTETMDTDARVGGVDHKCKGSKRDGSINDNLNIVTNAVKALSDHHVAAALQDKKVDKCEEEHLALERKHHARQTAAEEQHM